MDFELGALNIDEWYAKRTGTTQANFGTVVSQEYARMRIHDVMAREGPDVSMPWTLSVHRAQSAEDGVEGWSVTPSSKEQMNEITAILDEGLRLGALGLAPPSVTLAKASPPTKCLKRKRPPPTTAA